MLILEGLIATPERTTPGNGGGVLMVVAVVVSVFSDCWVKGLVVELLSNSNAKV